MSRPTLTRIRSDERRAPHALTDPAAVDRCPCAAPGLRLQRRIHAHAPLGHGAPVIPSRPCVAADTWVLTSNGPCQVAQLVGRSFTAVVEGHAYRVESEGFFCTGEKPLFLLSTHEGPSLRLTADHPVRRLARRSGQGWHAVWTRAGDLRPGDRVALHDHRALPGWDGPLNEEEGHLVGLVLGNRHALRMAGYALPQPAPATHAVARQARTWSRGASSPRRSPSGPLAQAALQGGALQRLAPALDLDLEAPALTPAMERASSSFCTGLLRGLADACSELAWTAGVPTLRIQLSDRPGAEAMQRMLLRLGVVSCLDMPASPGVSEALSSLAEDPGHLLGVSGDNLLAYARRVGFDDPQREQAVTRALLAGLRSLPGEPFAVTVLCLEPDGVEPVYDVTVDEVHAFDANGLVVHNCGEPQVARVRLPWCGCGRAAWRGRAPGRHARW